MRQWIQKHIKLVIGLVVGVISLGITLGITIPIISQSIELYRTPLEKEIDRISDAGTQTSAEENAYRFYGVNKNDDSKEIVSSAKAFGDFIFKNRNNIKLGIFQHKQDGYNLHQKLVTLIYKDAKIKRDVLLSDPWYLKHSKNVSFSFMFSYIGSKVVNISFVVGNVKKDPTKGINGISNKVFKIFNTLKGSIATANHWNEINIKSINLNTFGEKDKKTVAQWIIKASTTPLIKDPDIIKEFITAIHVTKETGKIELKYSYKDFNFSKVLYKQLDLVDSKMKLVDLIPSKKITKTNP